VAWSRPPNVGANPVSVGTTNAILGDLDVLGGTWTTDARASSAIWTAATTNPVLADGTLVSRYQLAAKVLISWEVKITMGVSTTMGTGLWQLVYPGGATPRDPNAPCGGFGEGRAYDVSVSSTIGSRITCDFGASALSLRCAPTTAGGLDRQVQSAQPFAWSTDDILYFQVSGLELA
jgi:hypothetical protein